MKKPFLMQLETLVVSWALLLLLTWSSFSPSSTSSVTTTWAFHMSPLRLPSYQLKRDTRCSLRRHSRTVEIHGRNVNPALIPEEIEALVESLEKVQSLPRISEDDSWEDFNGLAQVAPKTKPTFRRLFTHETWRTHIGGPTLKRWLRCMAATPTSVILRSVAQTVCFISIWATVAAYSARKLFPAFANQLKEQALPLSLCGNAIGLLLVFRTNQAYKRLEEARELMEKVVHLSGEITSLFVSAWDPYNQPGEGIDVRNGEQPPKWKNSVRTSSVASVCRHLAAFAWSLRDELHDGDTRDDVLHALLPPEEATWVASQRSRALAIHGMLRRVIYQETYKSHRLPEQMQFLIEMKLTQLSAVAATCERIFTSPIPPSMSRHGLRSMTLWMMALPIVLSFSVPPIINVAWTAAIAFIYLGIDELGVQVEQPFRVIPMWQLCQLVQEDILEFALHPLEL